MFEKVVYDVFLLLLVSAVVTYLPKSKADKKKSLLGSSPDSTEAQVTSKVCHCSHNFIISLMWNCHDGTLP